MAESKKYEVSVAVATHYIADQSDPDLDRHVFGYTVTISNTGNVPAQLISRHWIITDAAGHVQEVRGLGVVGHQPLLAPGQSFEYTSGCQLARRATCSAVTFRPSQLRSTLSSTMRIETGSRPTFGYSLANSGNEKKCAWPWGAVLKVLRVFEKACVRAVAVRAMLTLLPLRAAMLIELTQFRAVCAGV